MVLHYGTAEFRMISNSFNDFGQGSLTIENFGFVCLSSFFFFFFMPFEMREKRHHVEV